MIGGGLEGATGAGPDGTVGAGIVGAVGPGPDGTIGAGLLDGACGGGLAGLVGALFGGCELTGDASPGEPSALCSVPPERGAPQRPTSCVRRSGSGFAEL